MSDSTTPAVPRLLGFNTAFSSLNGKYTVVSVNPLDAFQFHDDKAPLLMLSSILTNLMSLCGVHYQLLPEDNEPEISHVVPDEKYQAGLQARIGNQTQCAFAEFILILIIEMRKHAKTPYNAVRIIAVSEQLDGKMHVKFHTSLHNTDIAAYETTASGTTLS